MVAPFETLAAHLESEDPGSRTVLIRGVCPPARSLVTAFIAHRTPRRPTLCVLDDPRSAEQFAKEISFFASLFRFEGAAEDAKREILLFPPCLPDPLGLAQASTGAAQERVRTLLTLMEHDEPPVVVTSQDALRERVPPMAALKNHTRLIRTGDDLDRDDLAELLSDLGYRRVPVVEAPGECAVRGSLIDFYPLTERHPFRVDFFGDTIEAIRPFQPDTQRSMTPVESVTVKPASPLVPGAVASDEVRARVKQRSDAMNLPVRKRLELQDRIERGLPFHEIPAHLPFFYSETDTLLDYMGEGILTVALAPDRIRTAGRKHQQECDRTLEQLAAKEKIVPKAEELFFDTDDLWNRLHQTFLLAFSDLPEQLALSGSARITETEDEVCPGIRKGEEAGGEEEEAAPAQTRPTGAEDDERAAGVRFDFKSIRAASIPGLESRPGRGLAGVVGLIQDWIREGQRVFLVCGSEPEKVRLGHLLHEYDLKFVQPAERVPFWEGTPGLTLLRGELSQGFLFPEGRMIFLHEEDIFGKKVRKPRIREKALTAGIDLKELHPGNHVVHVDFGIGVYRGLETLNIRGYINDYLHLEYANKDKLYLPVDRSSRIQKYVSTEDLPPTLDKLGGISWARTKKKVKESILAMAEELVSLYALRVVKKGHAFSKTDTSYQEFEAAFPYEETPDQMRAIDDVIHDMENERPMDRLVCGDVGYGKTEVAIRGAYKAVMDGKQVAVLVPTTVLAQQHYGNFLNRFQNEPVGIQMLSRFRSAKEQRAILEDLAQGKVDIIIGTHRLLQKDVEFRELGLLILDEEQRFGVRHKEALKKLRAEVDVLTLSATPIPRTLQMSLLGLRDMSTISTPPQDRHAIETYIVPFDTEIIRRALTHELARGGQAFFVHNRVSDIEAVADKVRQIMPQARIAVGHGQMSEKALERVMLEFVEGRHDILVCTTIIESGMDIPNANTLLVNRADRFGLAQLYQLRGRVGRSERQAFAYLIAPDMDALSDDARKRLEALYEFTELGSGFRIARYDMEIRGAGNLLGTSQSGQIRAVGYDLYMDFLEKAIRELKGDEVVEEVDPEIHFEMPALLPVPYIEDSTQRLSLYKRLATAKDRADVEQLRSEIRDRYGPLPPEAQTLISLMHVKVRLRKLKIKEARLADEGLLLSFASHTAVSVEQILDWAAREPDRLRLFPDDRLLIRFTAANTEERLKNIEEILVWLARGTG